MYPVLLLPPPLTFTLSFHPIPSLYFTLSLPFPSLFYPTVRCLILPYLTLTFTLFYPTLQRVFPSPSAYCYSTLLYLTLTLPYSYLTLRCLTLTLRFPAACVPQPFRLLHGDPGAHRVQYL